MESTEFDLTSLTADIVSAYVANNALSGDKVPELINSVYGALNRASQNLVEAPKVELKPAVSIKKSITPEYIICLEDGLKFKSLKRHLKSHYDMSPEEYREKWGLPHDYPMVAPSYAAAFRSGEEHGVGSASCHCSGRSSRGAFDGKASESAREANAESQRLGEVAANEAVSARS